MTGSIRERANFIWTIADLLRGDYRQADYGKVILPMTVLRRLDCVLEPTREQVLSAVDRLRSGPVEDPEPILARITGHPFHNTTRFTFQSLLGDPPQLAANLSAYIRGFSRRAREVIEHFRFEEQIAHLDRQNLLYRIVQRFAVVDLHPETVSNLEMGYVFEELIRRFAEQSNETAGEHFTPREVIRLMVDLLFAGEEEVLGRPGIVRRLYDPACGTGGMLSVAEERLAELFPRASLMVFGQELNPESFAICNADMMMKGHDPDHVKLGNSFSQDGFRHERFEYMMSNPPFGVEWKKVEKEVREEHARLGDEGRFGAGLPRINDGSLLFLQHMISKMKPSGSRIAVVFNGSPLFTGGAGSGESEIRRWIVENDWLEAIVALPPELFYNTGIATYVWIVTNAKEARRRGRVQLVDGSGFFRKMPRSLGNKRNFVDDDQIAEIARIHRVFEEGEHCRIFRNEDFGFRRVTVERPLRLAFRASPDRIERLRTERAFAALSEPRRRARTAFDEGIVEAGRRRQDEIVAVLRGMDDERVWRSRPAFLKALGAAFREASVALDAPLRKAVLTALGERDASAEVCTDARGRPERDPELRDYEHVPLAEEVEAYFAREVLPHVPDAWIDESKTKVGYEIPFTRHFYRYRELRPLEEIDAEIQQIQEEIASTALDVAGGRPRDAGAFTDFEGAALERVPTGWRAKRLKYVASAITSKWRAPEQERYVGLEHVEPWTGRLLLGSTSEEQTDATANAFAETDVLFGKLRPYLAKVVRPDFSGGCSPELLVIRPRGEVTRSYLFYYCISDQFISLVDASTYGAKMPRANWETIAGMEISLPSLDEQSTIAAFLDASTATLDRLIRQNEMLIELLREKRRALVSHAVLGRISVREAAGV